MNSGKTAPAAQVDGVVRRFVLFPGFVISKNDGDRHYIGERKLRHLYSIPRSARCVTFREGMVRRPDDIECRPRYDGKYPAFES